MTQPATTPTPPYYAVIFTSVASDNSEEYAETAEKMVALAQQQPGYLGIESAREALGITVSYWQDLESIRAWKAQADHQMAQKLGRDRWYSSYTTRIAKVEREYSYTTR